MPWLLLAALLAFFVVLGRFHPLTVPDEGRYAGIARAMLESGDWVTPRLDGVPFLDKPPLFYWLEGASFAMFGVHVASARLVPALLGVLGCTLVLLAGSRLYGPRTGLVAALVLATNPYYFVAATYVNHDLAVAVGIAGALLGFAVADRRAPGEGRRWLWVGYAFAGVALLAKGLIGLVFPLGIVGLWMLLARRWSALPHYALPAGLLVVVAIALPWYVAAQAANPQFFDYFIVTQHFRRFAGTESFHQVYGPWFFVALVAVGFLPWSTWIPAAAIRAWSTFRSGSAEGRTDLLLLVWAAFVIVFFSIPTTKAAGYVLPALPPLALMVARILERWRTSPPAQGVLVAAGAAMALTGLAFAIAPWIPKAGLAATSTRVGMVAVALAALGAGVITMRAAGAARGERAVAGHVLFGATLCAAIAVVGNRAVPHDVMDIARILAPRLADGDAVVHYRQYRYDLPFYLPGSRVPDVVVTDWSDPHIAVEDNWRRELWLGRQWRPESQAWLVDPGRLREMCGGDRRCFVVANRDEIDGLRALVDVEPIESRGRLVLLGTPATRNGTPSGGAGGR